jgi:hypothetical protein
MLGLAIIHDYCIVIPADHHGLGRQQMPVERLEDVLSRKLGIVIDPHRQRPEVEVETVRSPRPRECPERPNKANAND